MSRRFLAKAIVLATLVALLPMTVRAQVPDTGAMGFEGAGTVLGYAPPSTVFPTPLYSTRPEDGGFFFNGSFVMYSQNNPLDDQIIAVRGLKDLDGSIDQAPQPQQVGTFIGPGNPALDVNQVDGPRTVQPGFRVGLGWRFASGNAIELSWMHLDKTFYNAVATLIPPGLPRLNNLTDTFLFSGVFNFPLEFAGPANDTAAGNLGSTFGVWNAADLMIISFTQRNEFIDLMYRHSVLETENHRTYGLIGPSFVWFWERFRWVTTDLDVNGLDPTGGQYSAAYTAITSNRLYGIKAGVGHEHYLGRGFACSLDLQGGLYLDVVKKRVKYERGDRNLGPERKRARVDYHVAPSVQATAFLWWYPYEGIQLRIGYDVMMYFNTIATPRPVDFDYSAVNPKFEHVFRILNGLQMGVGVSF